MRGQRRCLPRYNSLRCNRGVCAAPGGKTAHLIERSEGLDVIAIETEAARLGRIRDMLGRLGLDAMLVHHDAADTAGWWKGKKFDRILIDAPHSGPADARAPTMDSRLRGNDDGLRRIVYLIAVATPDALDATASVANQSTRRVTNIASASPASRASEPPSSA